MHTTLPRCRALGMYVYGRHALLAPLGHLGARAFWMQVWPCLEQVVGCAGGGAVSVHCMEQRRDCIDLRCLVRPMHCTHIRHYRRISPDSRGTTCYKPRRKRGGPQPPGSHGVFVVARHTVAHACMHAQISWGSVYLPTSEGARGCICHVTCDLATCTPLRNLVCAAQQDPSMGNDAT